MQGPTFQITGADLVGAGLSFDVSALVHAQASAEERSRVLVDLATTIHHAARAAILPMWDDRHDLSTAVETLRALAVIVGTFAGDRHRHAADILSCLLQELQKP